MSRFGRLADFFGLKRNLVILLIAIFVIGAGEELWMRFVPKYLLAVGATVFVIGLYDALRTLLGAIYAYPGGVLVDVWGHRRAFIIFNLVSIVGYALALLGAVLERGINERLELGVELFGNSPKEYGGRSEVAFNIGGTLKLREHLNLLFSGGRDIVGDTHAMAYVSFYLRSKNKPMIANATPTILCHDGASRKNRMPATAMIAAPPARMAGTEESGPPF